MKGVEIEIHSSRAETASGESRFGFPVREYEKAVFILDVTAVSGTTPTLDVTIVNVDPQTGQEDTIVTFAQKTATGTEWKYSLDTGKQLGNFIKVKWTIGGTSPSFTFSVIAHLKG